MAWDSIDGETSRLRVEGGWIYRHQRVCIGTAQPPATMVFVPDRPSEPIDMSTEAGMNARLEQIRKAQ